MRARAIGVIRTAAADPLPAAWSAVQDRLVIGTVGRLSPVKDQTCLLRAVALLRRESPALAARVHLVVVGDGPLCAELQALVHALGLEAITWMPGERDDVPALLAAMDIFVLPSLSEGVSNTVLEAMAAGLPVIATAVGGNTELVEPGFNGSLVAAGDPGALARALTALLASPTQRRCLGANARERVCRRFDWDNCVAAYLAVYDRVLDAKTQTDLRDVA